MRSEKYIYTADQRFQNQILIFLNNRGMYNMKAQFCLRRPWKLPEMLHLHGLQ